MAAISSRAISLSVRGNKSPKFVSATDVSTQWPFCHSVRQELETGGRRGLAARFSRISTVLPTALAAFINVSSWMDRLFGSSTRSSCERLVAMRCAMLTLLSFPLCMESISCSANARLRARACTSSKMPSSLRKSSKLLPVCGLTLVALGIFPLLQAFAVHAQCGCQFCCALPRLSRAGGQPEVCQ